MHHTNIGPQLGEVTITLAVLTHRFRESQTATLGVLRRFANCSWGSPKNPGQREVMNRSEFR